MLWVLHLSDGQPGLLDLAERSGCAFGLIQRAAAILCEFGHLKEAAK